MSNKYQDWNHVLTKLEKRHSTTLDSSWSIDSYLIVTSIRNSMQRLLEFLIRSHIGRHPAVPHPAGSKAALDGDAAKVSTLLSNLNEALLGCSFARPSVMVTLRRLARCCLHKVCTPSSTSRTRLGPHRCSWRPKMGMRPSRRSSWQLAVTSTFRWRMGSLNYS